MIQYNIAQRSMCWLLPALLALAAACESARQRDDRRALVYEQAHDRTQQQRLRIPTDPQQLSRDYAHPIFTIRQSFMWSPYSTEWRVFVVDEVAEYAGFRVKTPYTLEATKDGLVLYFELSPPEARHTVALGLDDGSLSREHIPTIPIAAYQIKQQRLGPRSIFIIPLSAFGERDWDHVRGLHLVRLGQELIHSRQIIFRNLQFAPAIWADDVHRRGHE